MESENFKRTQVGLIPDNWRIAEIGTLASLITNGFVGTATPYHTDDENGVIYIQGYNVRENKIDLTGVTRVTQEFSTQQEKSILQAGDMLTVQSGHIGTSAIVPANLAGANCHAVIITRFYQDQVEPNFIAYYLNSIIGKRLKALEVGSSILHINTKELKRFLVPLPPLPEQHKIATILSAWNEAITLTERLIKALRHRKQSLLQLLLTGAVRFKEFEDTEWQEIQIGSFLTESRILGADGTTAKKITVRLYGKGVCPKDDTRAGSENTQYYVRRAGQFIYSKLDFLNGAFGLIPASLDGYESTLDLPAFDISPAINAYYFLNYVSRENFYKDFWGQAKGGRKARRIAPSEFLDTSIGMPLLAEQNKIADHIQLLQTHINLYIQYLGRIREQKRGLMQQLLTGAIRVQVDEGLQADQT